MDAFGLIPGLVTIAIPAYKRRWLSEAIDSALSQDYKNIEVIIVDDHSPQNLREVVEPYLSDERVAYYYNEENIGGQSVANNWNRCLKYAKGEFFVLLCDDDVLMPQFVTVLLMLADKYPLCNIFHGSRLLHHEETGTDETTLFWPEYETFDKFLKAKSEVCRKHTITEFLYRTCILKNNPYKVFPVGYFSDDASILQMVKTGGMSSSMIPVCKVRISEEQISYSGKYAVEKTIAAIQYYDWYKIHIDSQMPQRRVKESIDDWAYSFLKPASMYDKLRILYIVPSYVWSFKQKIFILLKAILGTL